MPADDVLRALDSQPTGLAPDEAAARRARYGPNALPEAKGRHPVLRFLAHFNNALIYFLLASAVAAAALGHRVDAAVIVAVVVVNAIVGFVQEGRAENALSAIRQMISPRAAVLRGAARQSVPVADLVPGDIVLLEPGDRVPADLRLLHARALLIDEAILTGESVASQKNQPPVDPDAPLGDRVSMAYSGTMVAAGQATGVVTATGLGTEIGRISALIGGVQELSTPLLRQINRFGQRLTWIAIAGAALLFAFAVLVRGYAWPDAMIAVVALAVSLVPEGLPAVITITLAIGVQRMAGRNAVIRRLPAVETLGAVSIICSDKTGTLTRNEMTARRVVTAGSTIMVDGSGYAPGDHRLHTDDAAALMLITTGLLCNDASLRESAGDWLAEGDPMEGALVTLAMKAGLAPDTLRSDWQRRDEIPFDSDTRYMATLHNQPDGGRVALIKGAPERLLAMAGTQADGEGDAALNADYWTDQIAAAGAGGERVLGFAMKPMPDTQGALAPDDVAQGLRFLGITGFIDPPRDEAVAAIAECQSAGIGVKMITGDHAATAAAIAHQLGLGDAPSVLTGQDLDTIPEPDFARAVHDTTVFARTSPEHKLRIVRALQASGAVVAMTGDGVNDAPSLKQADVGIAMGRKGTEAAKEAAQMVLMDDNFASIVASVHEGRIVYDNIRKVVAWTLPTNGGEVLTVIAAIVFNFAMPMTAAQILWINLVLTVTLGLVLAFEAAEPGVMRRAPRPAHAGLLSPFLLWRIAFISALFLIWALGVFFYALSRGYELELARTMVVNMIVVLEIFYLFNIRYLHASSFSLRGAAGTPAVLGAVAVVIVAQLAFTYLPVMQDLFQTRAMTIADGALLVGLGVVALVVMETEKQIMRRRGFRPD